MNEINSIAVFCGSSAGKNPVYVEQARELGKLMVAQNIELVYGGASIGIMGAAADEVMSGGGKVTGVIPEFMDQKEIIRRDVTNLVRVESMHARKLHMYEVADAIVAIPGGFGTMDELFESLTWVQLGLHAKPIGILNTNGYYDFLIKAMQHMTDEGFVRPMDFARLVIADTPAKLIEGLRTIDVAQHKPVITPSRV